MEQGQAGVGISVPFPFRSQQVARTGHVSKLGHAGRHDDWFTRRSDCAQHRSVVVVPRRNLERWNKVGKPSHALQVERGRQKHNVGRSGGLGQYLKLRLRELKPTKSSNTRVLVRGHKPFGNDRLELDRLCSRFRSAPDHFLGAGEAAFMIVADLGDNKDFTIEIDWTDQHAEP